MWEAAQRHIANDDKDSYIIHLGDHDPSGIDMIRDIKARLEMLGARVTVQRIALNLNQITQYSPPPNPAKVTDSRSNSYIQQYGNESWELDALDPSIIKDLIKDAVNDLTDFDLLYAARSRETDERKKMSVYTENS